MAGIVYDAVAICSPYGAGKTTITEKLFFYFDPYTFMCSKSVALKQFPSEKNIETFISDIALSQKNDQVLILNPHISDYLRLVKSTSFNIFGIFLNATKSTIERHLEKKGVLESEINQAVFDAISQIADFQNNKKLFQFPLDIDGLEIEEIARQIAGELVIHNIAQLRKVNV